MKKNNFFLFVSSILLLCASCCFKKDSIPTPLPPSTTTSSSSPSIIAKTLTLQPDAVSGKDAAIWYIQDQTTSHGATNTQNFGSYTEFPSIEWTFSGSPGRLQSLIQFDLSSIPASATITNVQLILYDCAGCIDDNLGETGGLMGNSNTALIQRITSTWLENTVTWNTQPSVTTQNQVSVPSNTSFPIQTTTVDVTSLVQDMVANPTSSFGFLFSQQVSSPYRSMLFASSDHSNAALHPKLVVQYE
jgi:hypothetical protein